MNPVISVSNLKKTYPLKHSVAGKTTMNAVNDISFKVEQKEIFGILGPNGAGKTTTLEIIEGLKRQSSGMVSVLGFDNVTQTDEIKKRIGIQLQSSQYLHHLSLGELLDLFASLYPSPVSFRASASESRNPLTSIDKGSLRSSSDVHQRWIDLRWTFGFGRDDKKNTLLELVGLSDKEHEEVKNLSGGQKQRFTIATALVHQPEILFLDEPTTGLDPKARRDMWQLIKNINTQGITIVLTTHFMEEAEFLCHRVAIMDQGKILELDEPKKLIDRLSQTIQVSFFTDQQFDQAMFQNLPEVKKVTTSYPKVILEISSLEHISTLVQALKQKNIPLYGFNVKTAALEDVYLQLTGKEYEE